MFEAEECARLIEVRAFWDGELRGEAVEELTRHLERCRICRDEYRECERFVALLEAGDVAEPLVEERREAIRAAVLEACEPQHSVWEWAAGLLRGDARRGRAGIARRAAWVLAPAVVVAMLVWLGDIQRPTLPGSVVVQTSPGGRDGGSAPAKRLGKRPNTGSPLAAVDDRRFSPLPKRDLGPAVAMSRKPRPGAGPRKRRTHERVAQAPLRKTVPAAEAHTASERPEHPSRKVRVAQNRLPAPEPHERLVMLAEGAGFAGRSEVPIAPPRRIVAAGGEEARAGQAAVVHLNLQGEQP